MFILLTATGGAATATPIEVHPIVVCAASGSGCAVDPSGDAYKTLFNQSFLDAVYAQTAGTDYTGTSFPGVTFAIDRPAEYDNAKYLNVVADQITSANGTTSSNPIDSSHLLVRTPGNAQSTNHDALNIYVVDSITATRDLTTTLGSVSGWGLISSNGAIITANSHIDTLAHELGHNLGLTHVDGTANDYPNNLMRSVGRNLPVNVGDPAVGRTIDLLSGTQANDQIAIANAPLFTDQQASATIGVGQPGECRAGSLNCGFDINFNAATSAQSITGVKIRWTDQHALDETVIDVPLHGVVGLAFDQTRTLNCDETSESTHTIQGSDGVGIELDMSLPTGCLTAGFRTSLAFEFPGEAAHGQRSGYFETPLSAEFDFSGGGAVSTALFDATTGIASTSGSVPVGARFVADDSGEPFLDVTAVPEPSSALLFAAGVAALAATGQRRRRPNTGRP